MLAITVVNLGSCSPRIASTVAVCGVVRTLTPLQIEPWSEAAVANPRSRCGNRPLFSVSGAANQHAEPETPLPLDPRVAAKWSATLPQPTSSLPDACMRGVDSAPIRRHEPDNRETAPALRDGTAPPPSERRLPTGRWTASTWEMFRVVPQWLSPESGAAHNCHEVAGIF